MSARYADPVGSRAAHVLGQRVNGKWTGCRNPECPTCTTAPMRPRAATERERYRPSSFLSALVAAAETENRPTANRAANIRTAEAGITPIVPGGGRND